MKTCAFAKKCGGCAYINKDYETSLASKQKEVSALLGNFCKVEDIIGADDPYYYRNKVHAAYTRQNGKIIYGTYEEGSHRIISNDDCLIENRKAAEILKTISKLLNSFKIRIYDERKGTGLYRRTLIRRSEETSETMVVLVVANPVFPGKKDFVKALCKAHPEITSIVINVNNRRDSMILGPKSMTVYGKGYITDKLLGNIFRISPTAFFQINHEQTEKLYSTAIELCDFQGNEKVLDAYCGTGSIGICFASKVKSVVGVEINRESIACAKENAKCNNVTNIDFIGVDCTLYMEKNKDKVSYDVIVLDPPRAGTTPEFIKAASSLGPSRICYVSCNPVTLKRDLLLFEKEGYKAQKIIPVDLFPWTEHVETVVLLSKLSSAPKLEVKISMSELDLTEAEAKATYDEIQDYVKQQTGLHVTHLNIAQIKRKHGIIERANYNLPKSENSRQPNCPPEKEKAIVAALKHFKMID